MSDTRRPDESLCRDCCFKGSWTPFPDSSAHHAASFSRLCVLGKLIMLAHALGRPSAEAQQMPAVISHIWIGVLAVCGHAEALPLSDEISSCHTPLRGPWNYAQCCMLNRLRDRAASTWRSCSSYDDHRSCSIPNFLLCWHRYWARSTRRLFPGGTPTPLHHASGR